jgi:hypothetical protein
MKSGEGSRFFASLRMTGGITKQCEVTASERASLCAIHAEDICFARSSQGRISASAIIFTISCCLWIVP